MGAVSGNENPRPPTLPLTGRAGILEELRFALGRVRAGNGETLLLVGPEGVGKSRLARAARDEGERQGFLTATGRCFPMESGVPYALFCDLLDPLVRDESPESLVALTRGAPEFHFVCPTLAPEAGSPGAPEGIPDLKNRLLWNFPAFLDRLRRDRPLLMVLDDLEWIDQASAELLHFLGRRTADHPFLLIGCLRSGPLGGSSAAKELVRSLEERDVASVLEIPPLEPEAVAEAVAKGFGVDQEVVRSFARGLHRWTGGNPLFVQASLESLVASGRLRKEGGRWVGWNLEDLPAPGSVRDLVLQRMDRLGDDARRVAEVVAVVGAPAGFPLLRKAAGLPEDRLVDALEDLVAQGILREESGPGTVRFSFVHPVARRVLTGEMGQARARLLHGEIASALLEMSPNGEEGGSRELAVHLIHAGDVVEPEEAAKHLARAGRAALAAHADREAAAYLEAALARLPIGDHGGDDRFRIDLMIDLARAFQRGGAPRKAAELLGEARSRAESLEASLRMARVDRRLALGAFWAGRLEEALEHWERGMATASGAGDPALEIRLRLAASACLQELGRADEAAGIAEEALGLAEEAEAPELLAAVHRTLLLLRTWTGPPDLARRHGEEALKLAQRLEDPTALFMAHWAMAVLAGLTGDQGQVRAHLDRGWEIARELESPLMKLYLAEIDIEWCAGLGKWSRGVDLAEESLRTARELDLGMNLSRLLVWSGLLHLGRGEMEVARRQLEEAWARVRGEEVSGAPPIHLAILVHVGRAALRLADRDFDEAIRVGEAGLEIVDRSGYVAWGIHRLLPVLVEACLYKGDLDRAEALGARLRKEAERFEHPIGLVQADACDALITWLRGDVEEGARRMAQVAEALEAMEDVPDAARLRRQLAGRFAELGDTDAAVRELRRVHDVLSGMGAEPELDRARGQFREVGSRPPVRSSTEAGTTLTPREEEIARLVAERKSNKAVGKALGISPRTVGTHLSNIYKKLDVSGRTELGDLIRAGLLEEGG